ncbi:nucleoside 2-deoxyribosyltransferase [Celeribacter indicus]|uniref:Nucleoside 2-deoxyribosyltransferase n=2 Tax=Rhodobacterales TaxID=204455 RepID=A0A0B5E113_9RHOB|nr:nucleoside 2-deoxyribosyltransferase [Celeribacter indicus]
MRRSAFCLANVTPFRGISADAGTVYEIGFMIALGRRVWAYTNDPHDYGERVRASWYGGHVDIFEGGLVRGSDGLMIESHGKADNLMIDAGIERQGGRVLRNTRAAAAVSDPARDLSVFEKCLQEMALQIHE